MSLSINAHIIGGTETGCIFFIERLGGREGGSGTNVLIRSPSSLRRREIGKSKAANVGSSFGLRMRHETNETDFEKR
jgi:hypothetical protein